MFVRSTKLLFTSPNVAGSLIKCQLNFLSKSENSSHLHVQNPYVTWKVRNSKQIQTTVLFGRTSYLAFLPVKTLVAMVAPVVVEVLRSDVL